MKFKRKKPVYKPKPIDNKNIDKGLEELFAKQKKDVPTGNQQSLQQPAQQRMNIPNPFGGGDKDRTFNPPNPLGGGNVPSPLGGNVNVANKGSQPMRFNAPNEWGVAPLNIQQNQPQQQSFQQPQQPTRQTRLEDFGMKMQQPRQPQQPQQSQQPQQPQQFQQPIQTQSQPQQQELEEEEPYWSAEEWETWAYQIAVNYPNVQQFLPEWFMQALQEEE